MPTSLRTTKPEVTMLQESVSKNRGGNNAKPVTTRRLFLAAYEEYYGNVTASCKQAGISRPTFYRWMKSNSRVNLKFRQQLERIRPEERMKDLIEHAFVKRIVEGSDSLIKFGLERKVKDRGYGESIKENKEDHGLLQKVATAFKQWLEDHPAASLVEQTKWLGRFAEGGGVDVESLANLVGISRMSGNR